MVVLPDQVDLLYNLWEKDWIFYELITDYYEKFLDPDV